MHTKLAKIALFIIICCLITLVVGAETSSPASWSDIANPTTNIQGISPLR